MEHRRLVLRANDFNREAVFPLGGRRRQALKAVVGVGEREK
jgi:hypothetical protein